MYVNEGEVLCLLGDNGAGKSTLIKTLSGVHPPDSGTILVDGHEVQFNSPRDALQAGIATVYQDLAMIPLMSISRNFFLGSEPTNGLGPLRVYDGKTADKVTRDALKGMGIDLRDTSQPVGTLSGGERQSVAIARAIHFGAKVVILDEPTSALGVKEAGVVLRFIAQARKYGIGVIFITHNVNHAYLVGDRFSILDRGQALGMYTRAELTPAKLLELMGGGAELKELEHELEGVAGVTLPPAPTRPTPLRARLTEAQGPGDARSPDHRRRRVSLGGIDRDRQPRPLRRHVIAPDDARPRARRRQGARLQALGGGASAKGPGHADDRAARRRYPEPVFPQLVSAVEAEAVDRGYGLVLCNPSDDSARGLAALDLLIDAGSTGSWSPHLGRCDATRHFCARSASRSCC